MTKEYLDKLYTESYSMLTMVCKKNIPKDKQYHIADIMTELYLSLIKKLDKIEFETKDKFYAYCVLWLWNNIKYPRTVVNNLINNKRNIKDKKLNVDSIDFLSYVVENTPNECITEEDELEYQFELQQKISKLYANVSKLSHEEQILFGLYFVRGFSSGEKLSKHLGISRSSCINMVRELKHKLKNDIY